MEYTPALQWFIFVVACCHLCPLFFFPLVAISCLRAQAGSKHSTHIHTHTYTCVRGGNTQVTQGTEWQQLWEHHQRLNSMGRASHREHLIWSCNWESGVNTCKTNTTHRHLQIWTGGFTCCLKNYIQKLCLFHWSFICYSNLFIPLTPSSIQTILKWSNTHTQSVYLIMHRSAKTHTKKYLYYKY